MVGFLGKIDNARPMNKTLLALQNNSDQDNLWITDLFKNAYLLFGFSRGGLILIVSSMLLKQLYAN